MLPAATLFSGIGAPECAMPEWRWAWCAEIDRFACAVLSARHPHSVNLGDVSAHDFAERALAIARPRVIVFGSPCQSFSVAGKRLGLDDPRGNMALVALGVIGRIGPEWFVFENVPGLLSLDNGDAFRRFLASVDELGYSLAWASLDAQWFGLAQRRERVIAVGYLGDWTYPAAVLFEPEGLCGDTPPRRETGQRTARDVAPCVAASGRGFERTGDSRWQDCLIPEIALQERDAKGADSSTKDGHLIPVAHSLKADGFDASEDGTGRGTPIVPMAFQSKASAQQSMNPDVVAPSLGVGKADGTAVAFSSKDSHANGGGSVGGQSQSASSTWAVRRLTVEECEFLQGFPRNYTAITYRGKPAADGPRYKALGNSMPVPVMRWILERVEFVHSLHHSEECTAPEATP